MAIKAFTIVSENYLPQAKTLVDSFTILHPDVEIYICVFSEKKQVEFQIINTEMYLNYNYIISDNLSKEIYQSMRNRYDNFSMACALKPFFAEYILNEFRPDGLIYLDADIYIYSSFTEVLDLLNNNDQQSSIILTPHVLKKLNTDNMVRNINYLTYGTYNAGFFAIKNNKYGKEFIQWWKDILYDYCIDDLERGIFYDQSWLNLVPNYFYHYYTMLSNPGYNVAYWNVDERIISKNENIYYCKDQPLVFYHFARYNYYDSRVTKDIDIINILMKEIFSNYKEKLKINGIENINVNNHFESNKYLNKLKNILKIK